MKKIILLVFELMMFNIAKAQKNTDINFIFKTYIFLNSVNILNNDLKVRNVDFYNYFLNDTVIKIDTLSSQGFDSRFLFLDVKPENIKIKKNIFTGNNCEEFKLVIDTSSGRSYRLGGFDDNDILNFFSYLKLLQIGHTNNLKEFLKYYSVSNIDFECLYKSAKNENYDPQKYPCSKRCLDSIVVQ